MVIVGSAFLASTCLSFSASTHQELGEALVALRAHLGGVHEATSHLDSAETLLRDLNGRLDNPLDFDLKREIVEILLGGIRIDTVEKDGHKEAVIEVIYRFDPPHTRISHRTPTRAVFNQGSGIRRCYWYRRLRAA
jgi:hypothetical protein